MPDFGTLTFKLPYIAPESEVEQDYLNYYDSGLYQDLTLLGQSRTETYSDPLPSGITENGSISGYTGFIYYAIGGSRIQEKKKYGVNEYDGVTTGTDENGNYSGYTFTYTGETMTGETLTYRDYTDGYTMITGKTYGFKKEIVFDYLLTRNEHFLGFVDEPRIYSDVFVERGKQGVMELNLRLGEVDNMGELSNYGNGYFKVRKQ
jgi:hypothetical protein